MAHLTILLTTFYTENVVGRVREELKVKLSHMLTFETKYVYN